MSGFATISAASRAVIAAAALAGSIGLALGVGVPDIRFLLLLLPFAAMFAAAHLLILGLPLYLYQDAQGRVSWANAAFAGFLVGGVPLPLLISLGPAGSWDGTRFGNGLLWVAWLGGSGLIGGLAFRAVHGSGSCEEPE